MSEGHKVVDAMDRFPLPVADSKRGSEQKGCRCGRTKCLKQYCSGLSVSISNSFRYDA